YGTDHQPGENAEWRGSAAVAAAGEKGSDARVMPIRGRVAWLPFAVIASPFVLGWLLVSPWRNVPVIDDWVYAWSVEHFLQTGQLAVSEISAIYPITQILWSIPFAAVGGFSFGVLRLSTVALAVAGCWSLYLMLRELDVSVSDAAIGALAMAL